MKEHTIYLQEAAANNADILLPNNFFNFYFFSTKNYILTVYAIIHTCFLCSFNQLLYSFLMALTWHLYSFVTGETRNYLIRNYMAVNYIAVTCGI